MLKKLIISLLIFSLAGCGFHTLYQEDNQSRDFDYEQEMAAIKIKKNRTKLDQDLKNNLYDILNPNYLEIEPKYFLILTPVKTIASTFTTSSGATGRNRVILKVQYELRSLKNGEIISAGSTMLNDNYDVSQNRIGTYTADDYVTSNLTKVVAKNIRDALVSDLIEMNKKSSDPKYKTFKEIQTESEKDQFTAQQQANKKF